MTVGKLYEIKYSLIVYQSRTKERQISTKDIIDGGVFLLIAVNRPYIDWSQPFGDIMKSVAIDNDFIPTGFGFVDENGKEIPLDQYWMPFTYMNEILLVDKVYEVPTHVFDYCMRLGYIYLYENKEKRPSSVD